MLGRERKGVRWHKEKERKPEPGRQASWVTAGEVRLLCQGKADRVSHWSKYIAFKKVFFKKEIQQNQPNKKWKGWHNSSHNQNSKSRRCEPQSPITLTAKAAPVHAPGPAAVPGLCGAAPRESAIVLHLLSHGHNKHCPTGSMAPRPAPLHDQHRSTQVLRGAARWVPAPPWPPGQLRPVPTPAPPHWGLKLLQLWKSPRLTFLDERRACSADSSVWFL